MFIEFEGQMDTGANKLRFLQYSFVMDTEEDRASVIYQIYQITATDKATMKATLVSEGQVVIDNASETLRKKS